MIETKRRVAQWLALLAGWLLAAEAGRAQSTSFSFVLDEPCKTSAGVFAPDGTLVRTLWSKVRYQAGTNSAAWNGLDDNGNPAPAGVYQIKVLQHNTEYVWDGAIGNTSAEPSGPTVHNGFWPMRDMAISGTNAFYVSGYDEGRYDFRNFITTDPQRVKMAWFWVYSDKFARNNSVPGDVNDLNWLWVAADANRSYFACSGTLTNSHPGCIVACNIGDNSAAAFAAGVPITNFGGNSPLPNGIYVGTKAGLRGLSVQQNGNLLAASVAPDNLVYLIDKLSGATLGTISVVSPHRLNFSPDGSLWVISSNSVVCCTNVSGTPAIALTLTNFSEPLDVAVDPSNPDLILVADGGSSQQVKAFDRAGNPRWTYGLPGGYQANGAAVSTDKFWFFDGENDGTFICFAPDGSFWVGDGGNHRSLHFSAAREYLEQIMYQPFTWLSCVDQNDPTRVFNKLLEFHVDYTKPLSQAWTLVNNWGANLDSCYIPATGRGHIGLREVTTFPNGRTYGLIDNKCAAPGGNVVEELCELGTNQLRMTGIFPMIVADQGRWISIGPDGSARATALGDAKWYLATLSGFDTNNNPVWNPETMIASAPDGDADPVPRYGGLGNIRTTISSNNILISFDQSLHAGKHLGGVAVGTTKWLWEVSPSVTYLNGLGAYEIANGVDYGGTIAQALDRQVVYGYGGEGFRKAGPDPGKQAGQAAQIMHYYDDGLFLNQFGEASSGHPPYEFPLPAFAANADCMNLIKASGEYYLWLNDESDHGPQRWHFANARNIRELTGSGVLGTSITLTNPPCDFPVNVTGKNGNQSAELCWQPVTGATSYNVYYSLLNGGPYATYAGSTTNCNFCIGGLTNGQTGYFVITAIRAGLEGTPSEQVALHPFDTSQSVLRAGIASEGGKANQNLDASANNVSLGQPGFVGEEEITTLLSLRELCDNGFGDLMNQDVGSKGFTIYDRGGYGVNFSDVAGSFTLTPLSGWADQTGLARQFNLDGSPGTVDGWTANPVGTIGISVTDTNFHYLTVFSPPRLYTQRKFTLSLTAADNTSAAYNMNEPSGGYMDIFQFVFKGNATLAADATGGNDATVQALFLDDAAVTYAAPTSSTIDPPILTSAKMLDSGAFQFTFTNRQLAPMTVVSATNLLSPPSDWTIVGAPSNVAPGLFQFTVPVMTNDLQRYYRVRSTY